MGKVLVSVVVERPVNVRNNIEDGRKNVTCKKVCFEIEYGRWKL